MRSATSDAKYSGAELPSDSRPPAKLHIRYLRSVLVAFVCASSAGAGFAIVCALWPSSIDVPLVIGGINGGILGYFFSERLRPVSMKRMWVCLWLATAIPCLPAMVLVPVITDTDRMEELQRLWDGLASDLLGFFTVLSLALGLVAPWIAAFRGSRNWPVVWPPLKEDECATCGYSLAGLEAAICPECGRAVGVRAAAISADSES